MTEAPDTTLGQALLHHHAFVQTLARRLTNDRNEADDLAQETFLTTLRTRPRLSDRRDGDPGGLRPWLARVLRSNLLTRRRAAARTSERERRAALPEAHHQGGDELAKRLEHQQEIVQAVLALDEPYRGTVLLRYYDEAPLRSIAERQGVPLETVRTRLRRAHARLRRKLGGEYGGRRYALLLAPTAKAVWVAGVVGVIVAAGILGENLLRDEERGSVGTQTASLPDGDREAEPAAVPGDAAVLPPDQVTRAPGAPSREPVALAAEKPAREAYWDAVLGARSTAQRFVLEEAMPPEDLRLLREVEALELPNFFAGSDSGLHARAREIADLTGIPIVVDEEAREGGRLDVRLQQPVRLADLLGLLALEVAEGTAWSAHGGAVHLGPERNIQPPSIVFFHSLADLLVDPDDYFAPDEERYPVFDPLVPDDIVSLVMETAAVGTWGDLMNVDIGFGTELEFLVYQFGSAQQKGFDDSEFMPNALYVQHVPLAHAEVQRTLDHLRRFFVPDPAQARPGEPAPGFDSAGTDAILALDRRLDETPWGVSYFDADWGRVTFDLERATGLEVYATEEFRAGQAEHPVSLELHDATVREVLCALERVDESFRWHVDFGRLIFERGPYASGGRQRLSIRDVRDLFDPPSATLADLPFDDGRPEEWNGASGASWNEPLTADDFESYVRDFVARESWDEDPANSLRIQEPGILFLSQSPRVLADVDRRLAALRASASGKEGR